MSEEERVATHEAGHAAMAYMLSRRLEAVSIVGSQHYGGVTILASAATPDIDVAELVLPAPLQRARFRRFVESDIMISLAGVSAAFHLATPTRETGYVPPEPDEIRAQELARLATMTPATANRLENPSPMATDEEQAERMAWAIAGNQTSAAYLAWLRAETDALVQGERFRKLVAALVPELLRRKQISGRLARRIFDDTIKEEKDGNANPKQG